MATILVLNGPNLNLLGTREPEIYGATTLAQVQTQLEAQAQAAGHTVVCFQSNNEGVLVDRIQQAAHDDVTFAVFNPGAYTHTSVALRDALLATQLPFIEVHLTNIYAREAFRKRSYLSDIAQGVISGLGVHSYSLALDAAMAQVGD